MRRNITNKEYIEKATLIHGKKYNYSLTEYINKLTKITIICPIHGEFKQKPYKHLYGQGCSSCAKIKLKELLRFDTQIFVKKAKEIHSDRYDYTLVDYLNNHTKVILVCKEHGNFKQTPSDHLNGYGCPHCKRISKGEKLIYRILKENNISFLREYTIPGVVPRFRYDFYLPELNTFIEFHGQQHYFPIEYFGGEEGLSRTKERDLFKRDLIRTINMKIIYLNYKHLKLPKEEFEKILLKKIKT